MTVILLAVLLATGAVGWWLSGYDSRLIGDNRPADIVRRTVRTGVSFVLVGLATHSVLKGAGVVVLAMAGLLAVIWASCISEVFAGGFQSLLDSPDSRPYDPKQTGREMDELAALVRGRQFDAAIALCRRMRASGDASKLAMETLLFRIYSEMFSPDRPSASPALADAENSRLHGRLTEAENALNAILQKEPANLDAILLLLRLYVEDLRNSGRTALLLQGLDRQPHVPPGFADYARRCANEWSGAVAPRVPGGEGIESLLVRAEAGSDAPSGAVEPHKASIDELLASGHIATAIEKLEERVDEEPSDFDAWMKLAEAYAVCCGDVKRAGKIIDRLAENPAFTPEQHQTARTQLVEWKKRE